MSDVLMSPRMQLLNTVEQALLRIRREDGYVHSLEHGLATTKVAAADVQLDACPWVMARIGGDSRSDKPVTQGQLIENVDIVVGALVKPDPNRWANTPISRTLEWLVWDIKRAVERHAGASNFGMIQDASVAVVYGPLDSYASAVMVYTYGLRRAWGQ